jgi:NAD(P)H-nitrite reductase large subunit
MRRLVVVGNGQAADVFLRQIQYWKHDFAVTVFGAAVPHRRATSYRDHAIDLRLGVLITAIDRHARVARGSDGSRITFDRLLLATGRSGLIPPGLEARRGVMVNHSLETSDGHVYAIGDCAQSRDSDWSPSLLEQAKTLAERLVHDALGLEPRQPHRQLKNLPRSTIAPRALTA